MHVETACGKGTLKGREEAARVCPPTVQQHRRG